MKNFKIVGLEQGTKDWLDWRATVIGSSDAPVIMSESPWKSIEQLLNEKLGIARAFKGNAKTKLGQKLEPQARRIYSDLVGFEIEPTVLQSTTYEWQAASIDGFSNLHSQVVEIKCGESAYNFTFKTNKVPPYYYAQLQHILAVTGFGEIDYFCFWPKRGQILLTIERDDAYIEKLIAFEKKFWNRLKNKDFHYETNNIKNSDIQSAIAPTKPRYKRKPSIRNGNNQDEVVISKNKPSDRLKKQEKKPEVRQKKYMAQSVVSELPKLKWGVAGDVLFNCDTNEMFRIVHGKEYPDINEVVAGKWGYEFHRSAKFAHISFYDVKKIKSSEDLGRQGEKYDLKEKAVLQSAAHKHSRLNWEVAGDVLCNCDTGETFRIVRDKEYPGVNEVVVGQWGYEFHRGAKYAHISFFEVKKNN